MRVVAVVDGNVFRFCLVILMLKQILRLPPKGICGTGFELMPKDESCDFNQAIMEFEHYNVPKSPNCGVCVLTRVVCITKKEDRSIAGKI
jgi:adenine-specific DNA glycosylase